MTAEEKTLILGALFHDVGKFEQRCTKNPKKQFHQDLGKDLIASNRFVDAFIRIVGEENLETLKNIISKHHNKNTEGLVKIIQIADRLSASERVEKEETEIYQDQWKHKHLASLFSKIRILNNENIVPRYYKHKLLVKHEYDVIIPSNKSENEIMEFAYTQKTWEDFLDDLFYTLSIYRNDDDFYSLINLLLIIFEKYMWCVPDFTGSSETDISLFNHLKDVAGFAHSIYLSQNSNTENTELHLIIGDIPGIQSYIFDVVNRKPAKILRGRSIFIQVLTRNLATKFLKSFNLTENNLIMLAGGKFYIVAPKTNDFHEKFEEFKKSVDEYLYKNFRMELSFNCAYYSFNIFDLLNKEKSFGQIVEEASHVLLENRYKLFYSKLFEQNGINYKNYVWKEEYIDNDGTGSESIKCKVTDKPIRKDRKGEIIIPSDEGIEFLQVDKQVEIEYGIGEKIVGNNLIVIMEDDDLTIDPKNICRISEFKVTDENRKKTKLLLNPTFEGLLKELRYDKNIYYNTQYIEVANYCSKLNGEVMTFEEMTEKNKGAKFLTLIKGDIDNLGLIMAYGLYDENNDLTAISRTTTLSNHLKYFFSFFLNGFLNDWEYGKILTEEEKKIYTDKNSEIFLDYIRHKKVYTIFAGGDDLMLITPQSSALDLIKHLNYKFSEFVCDNKEVHISYSITHFKDNTPIKLVADFAESNQKEGKKTTKDTQYVLLKSGHKKAFLSENDKSGVYLFNSFVKNYELDFLISQIKSLTEKVLDDKSGLSKGLIRKLYELSEMMKKYEETKDASYLIAYARLTYTVNRLLKNKNGEIKEFFDNILTINKENNENAQKLERILYPLICQVIYNIRK